MFSNWTYAGFGFILGLFIQLVMNFPSVLTVFGLMVVISVIGHFIWEDYNYWLDGATQEIIARQNMLAQE